MKTSPKLFQQIEDYSRCTDFLFNLFRNGIKLSLDNIHFLLEKVGNPHIRFPSIHIAGTNGKGSTAAMMHAILQAAGYRVGLYTSPHLVDFTERIRINNDLVSREYVLQFTNRILPYIEIIQPSFFEVTTAMAFSYFAEQQVDIAIIETGMGGRLDSTNVLEPLISVITPIDLDHQNYLGNTLAQIAFEKAGIIKPHTLCITNNTRSDVINVLQKECHQLNAPLIKLSEICDVQIETVNLTESIFHLNILGERYDNITLRLAGEHQIDNAALAVGTLLNLKNIIQINEKAIYRGLKSVNWPARIQKIANHPTIILDVSHNPGGFERTFEFLKKFFKKRQTYAIVGLQNDKDYQTIGKILAKNTTKVWVTRLNSFKALEPDLLKNIINNEKGSAELLISLEDFPALRESLPSQALCLIIGSHYLAGEFLQKFNLLDFKKTEGYI